MRSWEAPAPEGPDEGIEWLHALEGEWSPAAARLLGTGDGRDFLAPVWRCIGGALGPRPFDPVHPERHASWAYRQGQDWENLKRSVLEVPEHETTPVLLTRLAEAEYRLGDRAQAIEHWFTLCWRAPAVLQGLLDDPGFPDADIAAAWNAAQDQDAEPELSPEWVPAWMLLQEPSLAARLAPRGENDGPRQAFDVVRDLLTNRVNDAHRIALRRELKTLHPALLTGYAFGGTALYIICELPDDATAAVSLNIANAGALDIRATVLITPETVDEAVRKKVPCRPPGGPVRSRSQAGLGRAGLRGRRRPAAGV